MRRGQREVLPAYADVRGVCCVYEMSIGNREWNTARIGTATPVGTEKQRSRTDG